MTDALSVVRQATIEKVPIKFEDGNYIIGSHKFPESVKTIFKRTLKSNILVALLRLFSNSLLLL